MLIKNKQISNENPLIMRFYKLSCFSSPLISIIVSIFYLSNFNKLPKSNLARERKNKIEVSAFDFVEAIDMGNRK